MFTPFTRHQPRQITIQPEKDKADKSIDSEKGSCFKPVTQPKEMKKAA